MNVVVLMAGKGSRFSSAGSVTPKPFVEVNGKTIIEHTLSSIPEIYDKDAREKANITLTFVILEEHASYIPTIRVMFGEDVQFICMPSSIGHFRTAYFSSTYFYPNDEILFLDSDNMYDGTGLLDKLTLKDHAAAICYFKRISDSDLKWGFAILNNDKLVGLIEKDKRAIELDGQPMVGTFYFKSNMHFREMAQEFLQKNNSYGKELYMTMFLDYLTKLNYHINAFQITGMVPLGTPEDVANFRRK